MIDAVIYGYTPKAAMLKFLKAPPENKSKNPRIGALSNAAARASLSTPGTGTWAKNLNTTNIPNVNNILFLKSGMRIASITADINAGTLDLFSVLVVINFQYLYFANSKFLKYYQIFLSFLQQI